MRLSFFSCLAANNLKVFYFIRGLFTLVDCDANIHLSLFLALSPDFFSYGMAYRNHRDSSFVVGVIDLDKSFETNLIPQGPLSNSPK